MRGHLCTDEAALTPYLSAWGDLARTSGRPLAQPSWLLSWWRHCRPHGSGLLVAVVLDDDDRLVAVAPLYGDRAHGGLRRVRLLADETSIGVSPLAAAPDAARAIEVLAHCLAAVRPKIDILSLAGVRVDERWSDLLAASWPAQVRVVQHKRVLAPSVTLAFRSFDEWMAGRSRNFRQQVRRFRRRLESQGVTFHEATPVNASEVLEAFTRLHVERWAGRGGSSALDAEVHRMLLSAVPALIRMSGAVVHYLLQQDEVIAAALFLRAGGTWSYWLNGFDERHGENSPSIVLLAAAVEQAVAAGDSTLDLGAGNQPYKQRFADTAIELEWTTLVTASGVRRVPATAVTRAQVWARSTSRRLPEPLQEVARKALSYRRTSVAVAKETTHDI